MSAREHTTWTCDMCDCTEERGRSEGPPPRWMGLTFHKTATHTDSSRRLHICHRCIADPGVAHLIAATGGAYS